MVFNAKKMIKMKINANKIINKNNEEEERWLLLLWALLLLLLLVLLLLLFSVLVFASGFFSCSLFLLKLICLILMILTMILLLLIHKELSFSLVFEGEEQQGDKEEGGVSFFNSSLHVDLLRDQRTAPWESWPKSE